ncbi:zinc-ribbon domain-containing protein, partial [Aeoliella sp. ICT_H6.2]
MPKKGRRTVERENVLHPRYGTAPIESAYNVPYDQIVEGYWQYRHEHLYPQTAIPADLSKQNFSTFPREYYVDIQKTCRECGRPFIFFAREQQFWYEELGLYIDVDCVACYECRKEERLAKRHREVFSKYINNLPTNCRELTALLESGVYLWQKKELQNVHTLRRL